VDVATTVDPYVPGTVLAELGEAFNQPVNETPAGPELRAQAFTRALAVMDSGPPQQTEPIAALGLASDLFLTLALESPADVPRQVELIDEVHRLTGLSPLVFGCAVLSSPRLLAAPAAATPAVALKMLAAFAGLDEAAIFTRPPDGEVRRLVGTGPERPARRGVGSLAREVLAETPREPRRHNGLAAIRLGDLPFPAALIARGASAESSDCGLLMRTLAPLLSVLLEREARPAAIDTAGAERRLARLRFDLHDGPQQDVIMLADDLRLFRTQLASVGTEDRCAAILLGRLDDLQARLVAIDGDLRRICALVQSPFLTPDPFQRALDKLVERFMERSEIEPQITVGGELDQLGESQQIALLSLIRESLSNIRKHSDATTASVRVHADAAGVNCSVSDDGRGFDPETTLVEAARRGRLGLVGMHERIRMLGGSTHIDSRRGGPTVISVSLPARATAGPLSAR
jgi:signal transduction histidine kinase